MDILGCFHFGAVMNKAAMNICVPVFVRTYVFISLGDIPGSEIAGSDGSSMFNLLRSCQTVFKRLRHFPFPAAGFQFLHIFTNTFYLWY